MLSLKTVGVFVLSLLLLAHVRPTEAQLSGLTYQAVRTGFDLLSKARPISMSFLDKLKQRRADRGDHRGAERLDQLKSWGSYMGLQRGMPVLSADWLGKRHLMSGAWHTISSAYNQLERHAAKDGWADALVSQQSLLQRSARRVLRDFGDGLKDGATRRMLDEIMFEVKSDSHLASDAAAVLLGGVARPDFTNMLQSLFASVRSAFPAASANAHVPEGGSFYNEL